MGEEPVREYSSPQALPYDTSQHEKLAVSVPQAEMTSDEPTSLMAVCFLQAAGSSQEDDKGGAVPDATPQRNSTYGMDNLRLPEEKEGIPECPEGELGHEPRRM